LTGADVTQESYRKPEGVWVLLNVDSTEEADRVFEALAEEGTIHLAIQETFWAPRFGMLVDQFGIPWMVNCGVSR